MENLTIKFSTGKVKVFKVECCNEALTILTEIKHRSIPVVNALYRDIDLNVSLETLYAIASYMLRHDHDTDKGREYLQIISCVNTCMN